MRIAVFNIGYFGHVEPTVPMLRGLIKQGHDVIFVAHNDTKKLNDSLGCRVIVFDDQPVNRFNKSSPNLIHNFSLATLHYLPTLLPLMSQPENKPDLIIFEMGAPWGKVIGKILNIPCIQCHSGNLVGSVSVLPKQFWLNKESLEGNEKLKELYKVDLIGTEGHTIRDLPELNIFYTSPEISSRLDENGQLDKSFLYTGPQIPKREDTDPTLAHKLQAESQKRKIVYVSFGTLVTRGVDFYKMLINEFAARDDLFLVVSITKNNKVADLGELPNNCLASEWLPQLGVLPYVSVFVTHGGFNSINESLALAACPFVIIPHQADQPANAAMVTKRQIGVVLPKEELGKSGAIFGAVQQVLDNYDTFKNNAVKLQKSFTILDNEQILDRIIQFAKSKGIEA
eukprot:TRINITY_DN813_c0_g1_i16.p1 TRINITY_DN813_c0_g1~~TRINITY_DN813_c0_g1_i16.p1  ORF type:complete len:398 (-),score=78.95 TRINITY_DN813_c0_g1_i16:94-1287(-)